MGNKSDCLERLREAMGERFNEKAAAGILDDLETLQGLAEASGGLRSFRQMSLQYFKERQIPTKAQRIAQLHTIRAATGRRVVFDKWDEKFGKDHYQALIAPINGSNALVERGNVSISRTSSRLKGEFLSALESGLRENGTWDLVKTGDLDKEIAIELFQYQEGGEIGKSGSTHAMKAAQVINGVQRMILKEMQDAGVPVRELPGRITKQIHDPMKLRAVSKEDWKTEILPRLDMERTFGIKAGSKEFISEYLDKAYDDIVTGKVQMSTGEDILGDFEFVNRDKMLASKYSGHRKLHFSSGENFFEYNEKFGNKNVFESIVKEAESSAKNIGAIKVYGPDPKSAFESDMHYMRQKLEKKGDQGAINDFKAKERFIRNNFDHELGLPDIPGVSLGAKVGAGVRSIERMALFGSSMFSNLGDLAGNALSLRAATGDNLLSSHWKMTSGFLQMFKTEERQFWAKKLGIFYDDMLGEVARRTDADFDAPGMLSKAERQFFKMTLLPQQQHMFKVSAARQFAMELADFSEKGFHELTPRVRENLGRYGITADDWTAIRGGAEDINGHKAITSESVTQATGDKRLGDKISDYITDNAELAMTPTSRTKALYLRGTTADEPLGQMLRMVAVCKTFPTHMYHLLTRSVLSDPEVHTSRLLNGLTTGSGMKTMAGFIASGTVMGYIAGALKDVAQGKTPKDPTMSGSWTDAMLKSGAGGIYADFLQSQVYSKTASEGVYKSIMGPVLGQSWDAAKMYEDAKKGRDISKTITKLAIRNTPGQNLFWARPTLDYLILNQIQEGVNPGYLRTRERFMKKDGQEFYIPQANKPMIGGR